MGRRRTALFVQVLIACCTLLSACGGGLFGRLGPSGDNAGGPAPGAGPQVPPAPALAVLPALPVGAADQPGRRVSKEYDNVLYGSEYFDKSTPGADKTETRLVLYGPGSEKGAWGLYQWSGFTGGLVPDDVEVQLDLPEGQEYWLLLSNYSLGHWEVVGPLKQEIYDFVYDTHSNYVSAQHNTYVVVLVDLEHTALLNKLNLRAQRDIDAPLPPQGLRADNIGSHSADISWTGSPDQDVLGYRLYSGPEADFVPGGPGVVKLADVDFLTKAYTAANLESDTQYWYRLTAYDTAMNESLPGEVCAFRTLVNSPPLVDFSWAPQFIQAGRAVTFDPSATLDPGDDISAELFEWDFDNDGTFETQTTGPQTVEHTYPDRGPVSCRLRVTDSETSAQTVKNLMVSFKYDFYQVGKANGLPASAGSMDTDPATSRMALVVNGADSTIYYYHGGSWEQIEYPGAEGDYVADVTLSPSSIAILTISLEVISAPNDKTIHWAIKEFSGNMWQTRGSGTHTDDTVAAAHLCCSPGGLYSFGMVSGIVPPPPQFLVDWWCHWYHGKTGGGWQVEDLDSAGLEVPPFGVVRTDAESSIVYAAQGIQLCSLTDSGASTSQLQGYSGLPTDISVQMDPAAPGQLAWLLATDAGLLYWGDNFGAANGNDQFFTVPDTLTHTLGLRSLGDNEAEFYWEAHDGFDRSLIAGYNSAANSGAGAVYDLGSGYGYAETGGGGQMSLPAGDGVYFAAYEERDGEIIGRLLNQGDEKLKETLYEPSGITPVLAQSSPVIFPDGSLKVLFQQPYPTALAAESAALNQGFSTDFIGVDNYLIPTSACATGSGGEYLTASVSLGNDLVINRFDGSATGEEMFVVTGVRVAQLLRNLSSDTVLLVYTQNSETELYSREWNGSSWDAPLLAASTANPVVDIKLAARPGGGFGLAYEEEGSALSLVEKQAGLWGPPQQLSATPLNDLSGIGLAYSEAGDCACAVERFSGSPGVWIAQRPFGGSSFTWQKTESTNGHQARSVNTLYGVNGAVVFYYNAVWPEAGFGLRVLEKFGASWTGVLFDFPLYDVPVGSAVDPSGNIVMSGLFGVPATAVYAVIWR